MAEIPVEKKGGLGWLWLLLGLLALALIAWLILRDDDEEVVADDTAVVGTVDERDNDAMTTATGAGTAASALAVGDSFSLDGVRVTELSGDMSFTVDDNGTERFVVFNQQPTPGTAQEGEFDINPGQLVNLTGRVMGADQPMPNGVDATVPSGMTQYLFADTMTVAERP